MGQYYAPVVFTKDEYTIYSLQCDKFVETENYDYYNGLKLIEHSWIGNSFTDYFSKTIYKHPKHIVWLGDYAEVEDLLNTNMFKGNLNEAQITLSGIYERIKNQGVVNFPYNGRHFNYRGKYLVNHTKKIAFSLTPYANTMNAMKLYPVSLLTAVGNGKGGGDYGWYNKQLVGTWAFDLISIEDVVNPNYSIIDTIIFKETDYNSIIRM